MGQIHPHNSTGYHPNPGHSTLTQRQRYVARKMGHNKDNRYTSTVIPEHEWRHITNILDNDRGLASSSSSRANLAASGNPQGDYGSNMSGGVQQRRVLSAGQRRDGKLRSIPKLNLNSLALW